MRRTKILSITSGKGGVGKSTLTANLAYHLAKNGKKVLIFDGDLGMANIDIMYGVKPLGNISQVLHGEKLVEEIVTPLDSNIDLISGGSGLVDLQRINHFERRALLSSVQEFQGCYDYLLIDTAPGISDNVLSMNAASPRVMVVITPDPSSLTDSYALIKVLHQEYKMKKFAIFCNQVRDQVEAAQLFRKFSDVTDRFLNISLDDWGYLPFDVQLKKSVQAQRLILKHDKLSNLNANFSELGNKFERSLMNLEYSSGLPYFIEQWVGVA